MERLTAQDLVWHWDWFVDAPTAICNFCYETDGGHSQACGCIRGCGLDNEPVEHEDLPCVKYGFWDAEKESDALGLAPLIPTAQMILDYIEHIDKVSKKYTDDPTLIRWKDEPVLTEETYYKINKYAKKHKMQIPDFVEWSKKLGHEPFYDCNTGRGFMEERPEIPILEPNGWDSQESFESDRIPWIEYCERREESNCDWSEVINRWRGGKNKLIAADAEVGQMIKVIDEYRLHTNRTGVVVLNDPLSNSIWVQTDTDCIKLMKHNGIEIISHQNPEV